MKDHGQQARAGENVAGPVDFETPRPIAIVLFYFQKNDSLYFVAKSDIRTGLVLNDCLDLEHRCKASLFGTFSLNEIFTIIDKI